MAAAVCAPAIPSASKPSTSYQQQHLTRSIDKMFEEAELSGVLLVAGRKLKEFPSHLASKYDISDVICTDLSDNRLTELPVCICELSSMETLRVQGTGLRSLPAAIQLLDSLKYLDLSGNQLSSLPVGLFSLRLNVLILSSNRLEQIPREIRQMADYLRELDISCNHLKSVPPDLGLLNSLRILNLRDNKLKQLPSELSRLELRSLDVSENELTQLPLDLGLMCSLVDLKVDSNPLFFPPSKLCSKGREHAFKWLRSQACNSDGTLRQNDWSVDPSTAVNTTLPRGQGVERRSRSGRFNTLGGSDSGYVSTADEHRLSHELNSACWPVRWSETIGEHGSYVDNVDVYPYSNKAIPTTSQVSSVVFQRPQAIVVPMTSSSGSPKSADLISSAKENVFDQSTNDFKNVYGVLKTINKVMDKSNNNSLLLPSDDSAKPHIDEKISNKSCCCLAAGSASYCLYSSDHSVLHTSVSSKPADSVFSEIRPRLMNRCQSQEFSGTKLLSPVMEITDSSVVSGSTPRTDRTLTIPDNSNSNVTSRDDVDKGMSHASIPISSSGSSFEMNTEHPISFLKKPANVSSHVGYRGNISTLPSSSRTKLSKARDSIGVTRSHIQSSRPRKISGTQSGFSNRVQQNGTSRDNSQPSLSSHASISTSSGSLVDNMKKALESRLGISLPSERDKLPSSLADGVHLCNFANRIRIRSIPSVFTPVSPQNPLSSAKSRRNVDNFVAACRRLGLAEVSLCNASDILERKNLQQIARTIIALNKLGTVTNTRTSESRRITNV